MAAGVRRAGRGRTRRRVPAGVRGLVAGGVLRLVVWGLMALLVARRVR